MTYLLDTSICIHALRERPREVLERLEEVGRAEVSISVITLLELRQGAERSDDPQRGHEKLDLFLQPMLIHPFGEGAAHEGAQLRAHLAGIGRPIGDLDSLIAAHALDLDLVLVTHNLREFERVPGLRCETWLESS